MHSTRTRVAHRRMARSAACVLAAATAAGMAAGTAVASPSADALVDPTLWRTMADITSASLENASANGSLGDLASAQRSLSGCLSPYGVADAEVAVAACAEEFTAIDPMIIVRLLDAIEPDPTESTHPSMDHDVTETTSGETDSTPDFTEPVEGGSSSDHANGPFVAPSAGSVTSTFGDGRRHQGIDIANTLGSPIVAVADGEVISAGPAQGFGLWIRIRHEDGTVTTYGHNNDNAVSVGQRVRAGQRIATVGNRGNSTGPHLHFEVESPSGDKVDPIEWLASRGASILGPDD